MTKFFEYDTGKYVNLAHIEHIRLAFNTEKFGPNVAGSLIMLASGKELWAQIRPESILAALSQEVKEPTNLGGEP